MNIKPSSLERSCFNSLKEDLDLLSNNPLIDALMKSTSGIIAVLNKNRQILTINQKMLSALGVKDPESIFGARPGEALKCIHADNQTGGCGTSPHCLTCGAAVAIATALVKNEPVEKVCAAKTIINGVENETAFKVKAVPFQFKGASYILLFMNDISEIRMWASIDQIFYHDINNILSSLVGATDFLNSATINDDMLEVIRKLIQRLTDDVRIQQYISSSFEEKIEALYNNFKIRIFLNDMQNYAANLSEKISLKIYLDNEELEIYSDYSILSRIIINMIKNAYEASVPGDIVKLKVINDQGYIIFSVWNRKAITPEIQLRIFQKFFSTKKESCHGLGTYSIKLLGERILNGETGFTSSEKDGTTFFFKYRF